MTDVQFRIFLVAFVALVLAQVFYAAPKDHASSEKEIDHKFGWLKSLSRFHLYLFLLVVSSTIAGGLIGITGMFFFLKWAAVAYMISTLSAKIGSYLLFKGGIRSPLERTLLHSVTVGEILLLYLVFFGSAKELFQ